jgi:hypothetical protein
MCNTALKTDSVLLVGTWRRLCFQVTSTLNPTSIFKVTRWVLPDHLPACPVTVCPQRIFCSNLADCRLASIPNQLSSEVNYFMIKVNVVCFEKLKIWGQPNELSS